MRCGIHRTVHAGEVGPPSVVKEVGRSPGPHGRSGGEEAACHTRLFDVAGRGGAESGTRRPRLPDSGGPDPVPEAPGSEHAL